MPPTTGGSTSGSSTSDRSRCWPGNRCGPAPAPSAPRARTHSTVLAADVRRLSRSAARDDSLVISVEEVGPVHPGGHRRQREDHEQCPAPRPGPRPSRAARYGSPARTMPGRHGAQGVAKPASARTCLARRSGTRSTNCWARSPRCRRARRSGGVDRLGGLRERDALDLVAGGRVGDVDQPGVRLAGRPCRAHR